MPCGVARLDGLLDLAVGADHVSDPAGVAIARVFAGLVCEPERAVGVTEQGVGEVKLLREGVVLLDGVEGGAQDGDVLLR